MAPHRNQPLTQEEIEERLKEYLGAERIVWLNHGSLIGDDTDGHIDTLVRIAPDDTLLYTGGRRGAPRPPGDGERAGRSADMRGPSLQIIETPPPPSHL